MKIDRRTIKTKQLLKRAFIDLVYEKPINKITVKEMADLAKVNRSTFYQHYKDVYEVHEEVLKDFAAEFIKLFSDQGYQHRKEDSERSLWGLMNFIQGNEKIFHILIRDNESALCNQLAKELIAYAKEKEDKKYFENPDQFVAVVYFLMYGIIGLLKKWMDKELEFSLTELGDLIITFIKKGFVEVF